MSSLLTHTRSPIPPPLSEPFHFTQALPNYLSFDLRVVAEAMLTYC